MNEREEILSKIFEAEFCEPEQKVEKEAAMKAAIKKTSEEKNVPLHSLKQALLVVYPKYRLKRLAHELPEIPFPSRGE
jgi:hypothetical protein